MECNAVRNSPEAKPSAAEEKSGWDRVRSVVLRRGWNVGKKVAIVGAVVSSAPVVIPPLLFFSTLGFAVAFPFGVYFASFACTDLLMRSFLGLPNGEQEEEEEEEFFVPEEEMESEGDKEEEEIVWQLEHEEKGNGGMVEEEEKQREEAGMGEGKEVAEDKKEEEFPYDVNLVPLVLVYPDDKYPSDVYDGWIRGDIATEEQLMEEMKMREEIQVENEKDQEILVSSQYPSAAEDGGATLGAESGGEEKTEEEVGGGEQMEAEAEVKEEVGLDAATLKSEESLRSDNEELEEREAEVAPSSEYASDAKDGGVRGDAGLVGKETDYGGGGEILEEQQVTEGVRLREERDEEDKKKGEEIVGTAACETEGLLSSSSTVTVMPEEYQIETDPNSGLASNVKESENIGGIGLLEEDKPVEEMKMGEELGEQRKGKKEDNVSSTLEHENKIKQSTLSLEYVLAFEKGYEGAVGIMENEELIEEVGLAEAYAVEKGYERDVGIKEEEKLTEVGLIEAHAVVKKGYQRNVGIGEEKQTEEVAVGDAFEVEKAYERDVEILEEEKQTEVESGEAHILEVKGYGGDVGMMEGEKLTEKVGLGEAIVVEKYEDSIGMMDGEKPTEEVGLGEACAVEEKGYGGDVGITEKEKPTEKLGLGEATTAEEKRFEGDVGIIEEQKSTTEIGEAYAIEEYEGDVGIMDEGKPLEVRSGEACLVEEEYKGDVGIMEEEKPTEEVGLTEATAVEEKRYEGSVGIMDGVKPTDEVGLGEAYAVEERRYEGDVSVMEEGKPIEKVRLGEAIAVEEKRYEGDVGIIEEQISTAEVGFGEAYATEKKEYEGDVGTMDEGKLIEEEGLEEVCAVEEKGYEGDVSIIEELKPTEVVLGEATAIEEKGYEGDLGIMEEQKPTAEVRLGEACVVEEKGYERDVGITDEEKSIEAGSEKACAVEEKRYGGVVGVAEERVIGVAEEKLTEEVGLREPCTNEEKWYEGAVGMMEEEKPTEEVGSGEASVVKEKGNEDDAGMVRDKALSEEVGLQEKSEENGKEQDGVDATDFESENMLPSAYPSVAVVPEANKIGIEQSSEFASDVKNGGNRGDTGLMEEKKPVEQIEMRQENTAEEMSKKEDDVNASVQGLSQNIYPSNNVVLEEQENSVKQSSLSLEYAHLLKGNECGERVEMEKLTEDAGLGKEIEKVQKGEETGDTAALESEKLLSGGFASVTALLEVHRVDTEPSSELACDVKNGGNIGGTGLVGEEKLLEEMVKREEKGTEENEYSVGAADQGFSRSVCPSVGVVLEKHVDQVKQSSSSSESASVVKEKGHEGGVEMIEEKKPTESMDVGEEIEKEEGKEYECVYTAAMETEKVSPSAYVSKSAAPEVCETEIEPSSLSSEYASFVEDDGEGIGIKLVEEVQQTKETLMEERQEAENKVMKQEGVGSENKHQLQSAEHFFEDVVSAVQKIETEQSGMSLCAGEKEEREVLVGGKEGEGDSVADPKNDEALSNVDDVTAMEIMVESEPFSFNSEYVSAVEYQSLDMAETESRSSIEHGLDLRPGLRVVAVDTEVPVSSDDEGLYSEDKLWEQIFAIRTITGYKAALHLSPVEELKALFRFTGVNPPASMKDDSDLVELNEKLQLLKSVIGVQ